MCFKSRCRQTKFITCRWVWIIHTTTAAGNPPLCSANEQKSFAELAGQQLFVSYFFSPADPFFQYLFSTDARGLSRVEKKTRFYLVAVANTLDDSIGSACQKDLQSVSQLFTQMTDQLGIKLYQKRISAADFGKKAVEDAIASWLQPAASDIVVFYYSGHGYRNGTDTSKYPRMSMRINGHGDLDSNNLPVEDIYRRIVKKGARVNILLADCCNENIDATAGNGNLPLTTKGIGPAGKRLNVRNCRKLFFPDHPQTVLSSAAEANQLAVSNPDKGGFFTYYLLEELTKSLYGHKGENHWLPILANAQKKITYWSQSALCGGERCQQRPEIKVVPEL